MHGGDIYRNKVRLDFSVNVNPLGPPENVLAAVRKSTGQLSCYPDPECRKLREKLALRYHLSLGNILTGNGASELIFALVRAVRPCKALITAPGFSEYERALRTVGTDIYYMALSEDLVSMIQEVKPDLVLIANPNNPAGQMLDKGEILAAAGTCLSSGGTFAVDECFLELSDPGESASVIPFLQSVSGRGNIAVLRAFTKTYSIPGIRIGYMLTSDEKFADRVREELPDWNCSGPAQAAGIACLETDPSYLSKARGEIAIERRYLEKELAQAGIRVFPSLANYLLLYRPEGNLYEELLSGGILIRDCSDYRGLGKGYFRVAVKRHKENEILIQEIRRIMR